MNVLTFPVSEERTREIRVAMELADKALLELLRKAVVEWRAARTRTASSPAGSQHTRAVTVYLDAVAVILDKPGVDAMLVRRIGEGIHDIRRLANEARAWTDPSGPGGLRAA